MCDDTNFSKDEKYGCDGRSGDGIIVAFKNGNEEISILDVPAKIIDESQSQSQICSEADYIQNILLCTKAPDAGKKQVLLNITC